jgi:periplasmic protein CpxP/Spy
VSSTIRRHLFALTAALVTVGSLAACGHGPMGTDPMGMMDGPAGMMGPHGRHDGGPMSEADATQMRDRMVERATTELKLDATQKQRLVTLFDKVHAQRQAMVGGAGAAKSPREQFQALLSGPRFDRNGAQALVDGKTAAVKTASPELIAAFGDFFDGLNADQQTQVREFLAKGGHRGGMMGGRRS